MSKGVCPYHRLVRLYGDACYFTHKLAGRQELACVDARVDIAEEIRTRAQSHHHFFHGGIACALAHAVDGHLYLPRSRFDGGQSVGGCHAQIVMAMGAHHNILYPRDALTQVTEQRFVLIRRGVTNGIRHVDGRCPRLDGGFKDAAEIIPVAAGGILSRELDSWAEVACISNHVLHLLERFLETKFQFMCEVYCRGCQEDMDHRLLAIAQRRVKNSNYRWVSHCVVSSLKSAVDLITILAGDHKGPPRPSQPPSPLQDGYFPRKGWRYCF